MDLIEIEKKIVPEILGLMEMRYNILRNIYITIGYAGFSP